MNLSTEVFEWVVKSLAAQEPDGNEKRRSPRMALRATLAVFTWRDGQVQGPFTAKVRDISACGMQLELAQPLETGAEVIAQLPRMGESPLMIICAVVRCRQAGGNAHNVGVDFRRELTPDGADAASERLGALFEQVS